MSSFTKQYPHRPPTPDSNLDRSNGPLNLFGGLPVAFGGGAISGEGGGYGFGKISEDEAILLIEYAFFKGIKVFDTAPIYGFGSSEVRLGKALRQKRDEAFVISKCGVGWHDNRRVNMSNDPKLCQKMLEQSLKSLQMDYIDLYMIHWPDPKVDIRRPMEMLVKAQEQGKIKHLGLCNTHLEDLSLAREVGRVEVVQSEFSFFNPKAKSLFDFLQKEKIEFMGWGTLDKGILTGRVTKERKFDEVDARSWAPWWKAQDKTKKFEAISTLTPWLSKQGYNLIEFALGYSLGFSEITRALCGMKSTEQVDQILHALEHLPPKDFYQCTTIETLSKTFCE